jgi:hypothetical protein
MKQPDMPKFSGCIEVTRVARGYIVRPARDSADGPRMLVHTLAFTTLDELMDWLRRELGEE